MITHPLPLPGCRPTPLAAWLKAIGILRVIATQADPGATGHWSDRYGFVLTTKLDAEQLQHFLLHDYRPTELSSPWNGGSGFYSKDAKQGIDALAASPAERLSGYRRAIEFGRQLVADLHLDERPQGEAKSAFLRRYRSTAADALLHWFDAAIFLGGDDPRYPPLLGTGGNDGRLDFSNNFMQRLTDVIEPGTGAPTPKSRDWLDAALQGTTTHSLSNAKIGQFSPGNAGGPNAGTGFEAGARVNPWDFVLMIEGSLLFAAAASRRLDPDSPGGFGYPFTVRSNAIGGGTGGDDEKNARAEIWLPLWSRPASLPELSRLLAEGRARLGRGSPRDGLGFARAIAHFGIDRGIDAFQRYGFLMRSGKAYLATPLGRFEVRRRPETDILQELDHAGFLDKLRRYARDDKAPGALRMQVYRLENLILALTRQPAPRRLEALLIQVGRCMQLLARSPAGREKVPQLPRLSAAWASRCDDGSSEFHIAAALASIRAAGDGKQAAAMTSHLLPVRRTAKNWQWLPKGQLETDKTHCWTNGPPTMNLAAIIKRRLIDASRHDLYSKPFAAARGAALSDISAFLHAETDDQRIADLLSALVLCEPGPAAPTRLDAEAPPIAAAYRLLKPFFSTDNDLQRHGPLPNGVRLPTSQALPNLIRGGRLNGPGGALQQAWRALGSHRWPLPRHPIAPPVAPLNIQPERLLAALLIPLAYRDYRDLYIPLTTPDFDKTEGKTS
jgi:CRISPR-associated protein Csx17